MDTINYNALETPCFVLDHAELQRSVQGFQQALASNFERWAVCYSVKTNQLPRALAEAGRLGCWAEVVSADEYELARACGFAQDRIVYNGPMKSQATFADAIGHGAVVNIEAKRELDWLEQLPANKRYSVGLRLNINITNVSPDDADGNNDNSRFGFCEENGEFAAALQRIAAMPHVTLAGLHIHRTSHSRSLGFYENTTRYAASVIKKYQLALDYIDVGGGYFGIFAGKPTYQNYSDVIARVLKSEGLDGLCVMVEPGNALVASCFSFLTQVIDVKDVDGDAHFVTTDGSRNDIDPFFRKTTYLSEILRAGKGGKFLPKQIVAGCTCLEYDRFFTLKNQSALQVGDRILYHNVGAYTMCLTPLFIRYLPKVYQVNADGSVTVVRDRWTAQDCLAKSNLD